MMKYTLYTNVTEANMEQLVWISEAETKDYTPDALLQISGFIVREHYQVINLQENIQLREMTEESLPGILKQGF